MHKGEISQAALRALGSAWIEHRQAKLERLGPGWCEKNMRGRRAKIGMDLEARVVGIAESPDAITARREEALKLLRAMKEACAACKGCDFGR